MFDYNQSIMAQRIRSLATVALFSCLLQGILIIANHNPNVHKGSERLRSDAHMKDRHENYFYYFQNNTLKLTRRYNVKYDFFFYTCANHLECTGPHSWSDKQGMMMASETEFAVQRIEAAKKRNNGNCIVADVGANFGYFSLIALRLGCQVYSFEPEERNFHFLMLNFEINGFYNYVAYNMPVGSGEEILFDGWSAANPDTQNEKFSKRIKTVSMKDLLQYTIKLDWFKLDVEGFEDTVVRSIPKELAIESMSIEISYYWHIYLDYTYTYRFMEDRFKNLMNAESGAKITNMTSQTKLLDDTECKNSKTYNCQYNVFSWNLQ